MPKTVVLFKIRLVYTSAGYEEEIILRRTISKSKGPHRCFICGRRIEGTHTVYTIRSDSEQDSYRLYRVCSNDLEELEDRMAGVQAALADFPVLIGRDPWEETIQPLLEERCLLSPDYMPWRD